MSHVKKSTFHLLILFSTVTIVALTYLSLLVGCIMDQSILPPFGGGWRCYVACAVAVWALPFGGLLFLCLPTFARWLAEKLAI